MQYSQEVMLQKVTLLNNSRQLLFVGSRAYQRWGSSGTWEPFDQRILVHTPVPRSALVEVVSTGSRV